MLRTWVLRICGVLMTLLSFYSAWGGYVENKTFAAEGKVATLMPISEYKETTTTKTKFGIKVSETKTKSAIMTFEVNGQPYSINRTLPDDVFDAFSAGKPVQIEYLPDHPVTTARFVTHPAAPLASTLFGLAVAGLTWFFWRKV